MQKDYEKLRQQQKKQRERAYERAKARQQQKYEDFKNNPDKYAYSSLKAKTPLKTKTPLKATTTPKSKQKTARKLKKGYFSIFSSDLGVCYITGDTKDVVPHHIFSGADKTFSETYGFILPLRSDWHTVTNYSIHQDQSFNIRMKIKCQEYWVNTLNRTKEDWLKECKKWYSMEDISRTA